MATMVQDDTIASAKELAAASIAALVSVAEEEREKRIALQVRVAELEQQLADTATVAHGAPGERDAAWDQMDRVRGLLEPLLSELQTFRRETGFFGRLTPAPIRRFDGVTLSLAAIIGSELQTPPRATFEPGRMALPKLALVRCERTSADEYEAASDTPVGVPS